MAGFEIDCEACAAWIYGLAGFDTAEPPGPAAIAVALLGPESVRARLGLGRSASCMVIAHDVARWHLKRALGREPSAAQIESLTLVLIIPEKAVRKCVEDHGMDAVELARAFHVPEWVAARRIRHTIAPARSGEQPSVPRIPLDVSR